MGGNNSSQQGSPPSHVCMSLYLHSSRRQRMTSFPKRVWSPDKPKPLACVPGWLAGWLDPAAPVPRTGRTAVPPWRGSDICCYGASHPHKQGAMSLTEEPRGGMGGLFFSFLLLHAMPCIVEGRQVT